MRCAAKQVPVRSDHTRGSVVSVVEEGETGGVPHGRPDEPGGRRPKGHQAGLAGGGSLLQEGDDDTEELLVGVVEDRLMEISADGQSVHPSAYQPPACRCCCCSPCRGSLGAHTRLRDRSQLAPTRSVSRSRR